MLVTLWLTMVTNTEVCCITLNGVERVFCLVGPRRLYYANGRVEDKRFTKKAIADNFTKGENAASLILPAEHTAINRADTVWFRQNNFLA